MVALVQKGTLPFVIYKTLLCTSMTSSVLSPKIIYLILPEVKNLWSVKCEQIILSVWSVTYVLCQTEAQPARNYQFFQFFANLQKFTELILL